MARINAYDSTGTRLGTIERNRVAVLAREHDAHLLSFAATITRAGDDAQLRTPRWLHPHEPVESFDAVVIDATAEGAESAANRYRATQTPTFVVERDGGGAIVVDDSLAAYLAGRSEPRFLAVPQE